MNDIISVLRKSNPTIEELLACFELIRKDGNVVVIKMDGARADSQYTVFVTFSEGEREMIRFDGDNFKGTLLEVLRAYHVEK
ncbi:hypothetical protein WJU16_00810 [Chitinophaga pollutisoli]|uniref:Uncharacterized protein n=1 Tax=Chitinophaga pollutisoli TaxID=3133966 RepID=A0ABZ2YQD2_9BACT